MITPSCSGVECSTYGILLVLSAALIGVWAILAGLTAAQAIRWLAMSGGWARWDAPVRVAAFLGSSWLVLRVVSWMSELSALTWFAVVLAVLASLAYAYVWLLRSNRPKVSQKRP